MSKANQLREALRKHNNRLPYADALKIVGTRGGMSNMITNGEIEVIDEDEGKFVTLDPDFKIKQALPIKRKSKRAKGSKKKHSKAPRTMKEVAKRFVDNTPAASTASVRDLAINNLIASAKALADTLRREVEGVENNPNLMAAIETQERAAEIARVA